jgi:hypothetical protein
MARSAQSLLPILTLVVACGRLPLPGTPRPDGSTETNPPGVEAGPSTYRESTERFTQIAAGSGDTCGVTTDGRVRCWGHFGDCRDLEGECSTQRGEVPKRIDQTAKHLSLWPGYACAINQGDSIDCWGSSRAPAHVEGVFSALSIPYAIQMSGGAILGWDNAPSPPDGSFVSVSGYRYYCGLRSDGTLACWGFARSDGGADQPPPGTFTQLAVTNSFGCALGTDSEVVCWGWGINDWEIEPQFSPLPGGTFTQIAAHAYWACGVRTDGFLACWGELFGFVPPDGPFIQVTVGDTEIANPPDYATAYFCALRADGIAVCWGANPHGESSPP